LKFAEKEISIRRERKTPSPPVRKHVALKGPKFDSSFVATGKESRCLHVRGGGSYLNAKKRKKFLRGRGMLSLDDVEKREHLGCTTPIPRKRGKKNNVI